MRLPFPGERYIHGPLDLLRRIWRDTLDQPDPGDLAERRQARVQRPVRRLRPRRRDRDRPRRRHRLDADPDQRRRPVGRPLPRPVGPRHRRPVRRRARPGRPEVHPDRHGPPVLARPARVRRPRQGGAAVAGGPGPGGADRGARRGAGRRPRRRSRRSRPACRCWRPRSPPSGWRRASRSTGRRACGRAARAARRSWPRPRTRAVELETAIDGGRATARPSCAPGASTIRAPTCTTRPCPSRRTSPSDAGWRRPGPPSASACSSSPWRSIIWFRILSPVAAIVVLFGIYLGDRVVLPARTSARLILRTRARCWRGSRC